MAILARISHQFNDIKNLFKKGEDVTISQYLDPNLVIFLKSSSRDGALLELTELLQSQDKITSEDKFFEAILKREEIVSTGVGMGVAIPHAKMDRFEDFFIAIAIEQSMGGIEWEALDGAPVRLIFMIGGPSNRQTDYLKILSSLTMAIKDEERRKKLLFCKTPEEVLSIFSEC